MNDLQPDSKVNLDNLKFSFKAYTVNGHIFARVDGTHVTLGQVKNNQVYLNKKARELLESIPKMSMPMVPVGVVHITKPVEPKAETPRAPRKPRVPRKPKEEVPDLDLSGLEDLK